MEQIHFQVLSGQGSSREEWGGVMNSWEQGRAFLAFHQNPFPQSSMVWPGWRLLTWWSQQLLELLLPLCLLAAPPVCLPAAPAGFYFLTPEQGVESITIIYDLKWCVQSQGSHKGASCVAGSSYESDLVLWMNTVLCHSANLSLHFSFLFRNPATSVSVLSAGWRL